MTLNLGSIIQNICLSLNLSITIFPPPLLSLRLCLSLSLFVLLSVSLSFSLCLSINLSLSLSLSHSLSLYIFIYSKIGFTCYLTFSLTFVCFRSLFTRINNLTIGSWNISTSPQSPSLLPSPFHCYYSPLCLEPPKRWLLNRQSEIGSSCGHVNFNQLFCIQCTYCAFWMPVKSLILSRSYWIRKFFVFLPFFFLFCFTYM